MTISIEDRIKDLDRLVQFDERSRGFNIRETLEAAALPLQPRSYTWSCAAHLDQLAEGACVGFSMAHEAMAKPKPKDVNAAFARGVYYDARKIDPWPGEDYDGTSVLAGAKVMKRLGYWGEYRWAFTLMDFLNAVSRFGPGIIGVNWTWDMMRPDKNGIIRPTGGNAGGHATLVKGVNVKKRQAKIHQSWGVEHGLGGDVIISWDDLGERMDDDGEMLLPVIRL